MSFKQYVKSSKRRYFGYFLAGVVISAIYFVVMIHWMDIIRFICHDANLVWDRQPKLFKFFNIFMGYLLWTVGLLLLVRGIIKKDLVPFISVSASFLVFYVVLIFYIIAWPGIVERMHRIPFNAEEWRRHQSDETLEIKRSPRLEMVDDLLGKKLLIGKSREQVIVLLGNPEAPSAQGDDFIQYYLGPERGFMSIDSEFLMIKFKDNKVVEARTRTD